MRDANAEELSENEARIKRLEEGSEKPRLGFDDNGRVVVPISGALREISFGVAAKHIEFLNRQVTEGARWAYGHGTNALVGVLSPRHAGEAERHFDRVLISIGEEPDNERVRYPGSCPGC